MLVRIFISSEKKEQFITWINTAEVLDPFESEKEEIGSSRTLSKFSGIQMRS